MKRGLRTVAALVVFVTTTAGAQVPDFSSDIEMTQTLGCPDCATTTDFRNAAITACLEGYREVSGGIGNIAVWAPTGGMPGVPPGSIGWGGPNDACVYQMEIRGNLWRESKVFLEVCNADSDCRLVFHQYNLECLGADANIGFPPIVVGGSFCLPIGLEGLCTTVRDMNLNESSSCLTSISQRGSFVGDLPDQPTSPPSGPPGSNPDHGEQNHTHNPQCNPGIFWQQP